MGRPQRRNSKMSDGGIYRDEKIEILKYRERIGEVLDQWAQGRYIKLV